MFGQEMNNASFSESRRLTGYIFFPAASERSSLGSHGGDQLTGSRSLEADENMMELLGRISATDCVKLCHRVVDGLCGREPPCRSDYSKTWSLEEWLQLMDSLTGIFRLAVGNNVPDEEVLANLSNADRGQAEALLSVLRARQEEIRRALVDRTNSISSATLQDFDWQLKLALSSDKISSLNTPLLSLCLDVRENGALRPITMELNREELNTLISSLEAANKVVLQLK